MFLQILVFGIEAKLGQNGQFSQSPNGLYFLDSRSRLTEPIKLNSKPEAKLWISGKENN